MLLLLTVSIVLAWLGVVALAWLLVRLAVAPAHRTPAPVHAPQSRQDAPQTFTPEEVQQIMRQLGRRDAAGRAMAERILAAAGPRRSLR